MIPASEMAGPPIRALLIDDHALFRQSVAQALAAYPNLFVEPCASIRDALALLSQTHRRRLAEIARQMTYLDLSSEPDYLQEYTAALFLPHTDATLFPSVMRPVTSLDSTPR